MTPRAEMTAPERTPTQSDEDCDKEEGEKLQQQGASNPGGGGAKGFAWMLPQLVATFTGDPLIHTMGNFASQEIAIFCRRFFVRKHTSQLSTSSTSQCFLLIRAFPKHLSILLLEHCHHVRKYIY